MLNEFKLAGNLATLFILILSVAIPELTCLQGGQVGPA